ncbi:MAG: ABC transporter permease [Ignisphaera sp.]
MTFLQLVKREVKAFIKNPGFLVGLVIMVVMFNVIGSITSRATETAAKEVEVIDIGLVVEEKTALVQELVKLLNITIGGRARIYPSLEEAISCAGIGIVIPAGFTSNVTSLRAPVALIGGVKVETLSMIIASARLSMLEMVSRTVERLLPIAVGIVYNVSIEPQKTVGVKGSTIMLFSKRISQEEFMSITFFASIIPLLIGIILAINASYASQLVAMEKVEKAFEMLLAQPIKRRDIVLAKILSASVASIIFGAIYMGGLFMSFSQSTPSGPSTSTQTSVQTVMLKTLGFETLITTALTLIISLVLSGAIGVVVGSLVSDERIAGVLTAPIMLIFMGFGFVTMYLGLTPDIISAIIAGLTVVPITYLSVASTLSGNLMPLVLSVSISLMMCTTFIFIAASIFNRDIVVLGLRIGWAKKMKEST